MSKYTFPDGRVLTVKPDENPEDPRSWDNLGTMVCRNRLYWLGDDVPGLDIPEGSTISESVKLLRELRGDTAEGYKYLTLYLYDHSGLRISSMSWKGRAPHAEWDSGVIGFIYVSAEDIKINFGERPDAAKKAVECLQAEVDVYDQYLSGDVWRYTLSSSCPECGQERWSEDSCGGFYGSDPLENGMIDSLPANIAAWLKSNTYEETD